MYVYTSFKNKQILQAEILPNDKEDGDIADTKIHYAVLQSELTGDMPKELEQREKAKYSEDINRLSNIINNMEKDIDEVRKDHESRMENAKSKYTDIIDKLQKITRKLMKTDEYR